MRVASRGEARARRPYRGQLPRGAVAGDERRRRAPVAEAMTRREKDEGAGELGWAEPVR
jgi:hypothetical protein